MTASAAQPDPVRLSPTTTGELTASNQPMGTVVFSVTFRVIWSSVRSLLSFPPTALIVQVPAVGNPIVPVTVTGPGGPPPPPNEPAQVEEPGACAQIVTLLL